MPREPVTGTRIHGFLHELGQRYRGSGRFYLVGGSQMVLAGSRRQTADIAYLAVIEDSPQEFTTVLRSLIRDMNISVEPAHPGDFIPLPSGWEDRSAFLGRYGNLDVFTFDPVSTALSKIERGTDRDIQDAVTLVREGTVELDGLTLAFKEILPRLERESLRVDEYDFQRKFDAFMRLVAEREGFEPSRELPP